MTPTFLIAVAGLALGGACIAVQAPLNAALGRMVADPFLAAAISFSVGLVALAALTLARSGPPQLATLAALPGWAWAGGLLGAAYVTASVWGVPRTGVLTAVAAIVFGQMTAALAMDALGAFGVAAQPVTWRRAGAAALVLAGVVLSRA